MVRLGLIDWLSGIRIVLKSFTIYPLFKRSERIRPAMSITCTNDVAICWLVDSVLSGSNDAPLRHEQFKYTGLNRINVMDAMPLR